MRSKGKQREMTKEEKAWSTGKYNTAGQTKNAQGPKRHWQVRKVAGVLMTSKGGGSKRPCEDGENQSKRNTGREEREREIHLH